MSQRGASREGAGDGVHPELDGRCPQHGEGGREIVGEALDDDRVAAERQVGSVLLGGAHRHDERGAAGQQVSDRDRSHFLHPPGASGLSHRPPWWLVWALASVVAAAEWLRRPSLPWVVVGAVAVLACLVALAPWPRWRHRGLAAALVGLIATIAVTQARLTAIETRWAEQRERRVEAASRRLDGDLHAALHQADRLAQSALAAPRDDRAAALRLLETAGARQTGPR